MKNHLSFDVEEGFQSSNFEQTVPRERWADLAGRVETNTDRILGILSDAGVTATFFLVGWVADRFPAIVRLIDRAGHEIAAHSYFHQLVYDLTPAEFREDLRRNVSVIASITGKSVLGYRAPSYTITGRSLWALDILAEEGFVYDSSVYPVRFHPRYGLPGAPRSPYRHANGLGEFPMPVYSLFGQQFPVATGFYFRFLPYSLTRLLMQRINRQGIPVTVNIHPWELDPGQPKLPATPTIRFRHYHGLKHTERRLQMLLRHFEFESLGKIANSIFGQPAHRPELSSAKVSS